MARGHSWAPCGSKARAAPARIDLRRRCAQRVVLKKLPDAPLASHDGIIQRRFPLAIEGVDVGRKADGLLGPTNCNRARTISCGVGQTIQLLDEVRTLKNSKDFIFPSQKNIRKAMSENTLLYALYRMGYHSRTTVHGFRSTASTVLNESRKWHPDVIERQLAHVEGNKVRAAYNHAEYLDERREMMQWWSDKLDEFKECST